ncbi:MAG TPA: DUF4350 domain-containing protein [Crocinitomix sp.]|nr:DUF4350 domain-containing protein [Crocinitomix sp.]
MNKTKKNIIVIGSIVLLAVVLIYFFGLKKQEPDITTTWYKTYQPDDVSPYGTYMMKELLDTLGLFDKFIEIDNKITESLTDTPNQNDIYFFIGEDNYMSDESVEKLLDFVYDGNTAFISTKKLPLIILDEFFINGYTAYYSTFDSTQTFKFTHKKLKNNSYHFKYVYENLTTKHSWVYFIDNNTEEWEDAKSFILGTSQNKHINFLKFSYGDGAMFFHTTPYLFTNISMFTNTGFEYAENILKHVPPGKIQWDKYNLKPHNTFKNNKNKGDGDMDRRSPLEFIFNHIALTWAFVILLLTALLYMLFKGKRMQNIIKPAELKENTSLKYVQTVSSLYLQEKKHGKLIALKEKTFMNFIADHYYLSTHQPDKKFIEKLALKSQVDENKITEIFELFNKLKGKDVVLDEVLIQLHHKIEYFYKNCK